MLFANFGPTCVKKELAISDFSVMFVSLLPWKESCKSYFFLDLLTLWQAD